MYSKIALASVLLKAAHGQQIGTLAAETHPALTWEKCTAAGSCTPVDGKVTMDANWRWVHSSASGSSTNCYTGSTWDATLCPDDVTCAANCALDGADYTGTYGVTASDSSLKLDFVTGSNVGSRLYLMADDKNYETFYMLNQEFTFDVDVSKLPCGLNGALYMVNMPSDGGLSDTNAAGAAYGTGYCDSQCPRDIKFIAGEANVAGWTPESNSANSGNGNRGACCAEMDIWEANSISAAYTPHAGPAALTVCTGDTCGGTYSTDRYAGDTDPDGCDFNSYRQGNLTFYGPGMTVDTSKVFTVVTQFLTDDGTATGNLNEIKRFYVQGGVVIPNSESTIAGITGNSVNTEYCEVQPVAFNDTTSFKDKGGFASMTGALKAGMVLVLSLWDDYAESMIWLDSNNPATGDASTPGVARGTCATTSGVPADVESSAASAYVTYSNIKVGAINSTFSAPVDSSVPVASSATVASSAISTASVAIASSASVASATVESSSTSVAVLATSSDGVEAASTTSAASVTIPTTPPGVVATSVASRSVASESGSSIVVVQTAIVSPVAASSSVATSSKKSTSVSTTSAASTTSSVPTASETASRVTEPEGTTLGDLLKWLAAFYNKYAATSYSGSTVARRHARMLRA